MNIRREDYLDWVVERPKDKYGYNALYMIRVDTTFAGIRIEQSWSDLRILEHILSMEKPDIIIELGTKYGASALFFSLFTKTYTFDIKKYNIPKNDNIVYTICDIFENTEKIKSLIQKNKKVFLFCDNGKKPKEFEVFAPMLKKDDLIFVHDYGIEITHKDVAGLVQRLHLKEIPTSNIVDVSLLRGWRKT